MTAITMPPHETLMQLAARYDRRARRLAETEGVLAQDAMVEHLMYQRNQLLIAATMAERACNEPA